MNPNPPDIRTSGNPPPAPLRLLTRPVPRYLVAVVLVGLAFLLRVALADVFGPRLIYITFFPAVMLAALLCSFGPGLLATGLSALCATIWILPPVGSIAISETVDAIGLAVFVCQGIFMSVVAGLYHQAGEKVAAYEQEQTRRASQQPAVAALDTFHFPEETLSFKKRLAFDSALALVLAILLSVGWLAYRNMTASTEADRRQTQTYVVIDEMQDLLSSLKDAETGQRGYVITGDPKYLEPYRASLSEIGTHLAALRSLTADNPRQQQRLAAIAPLVAAKLAELKETIAIRETKGFQATSEAVSTDRGKEIMDELRALVGQAQRDEEQSLQARVAEKETNTRKTVHSVVLGGTLGVLALLGLFISLRWELVRRQRAESRLRQEQKALRESEERLRTIGDRLPGGLIYLYGMRADGSPFFSYLSGGAERSTGYRAEELLAHPGKAFENILPEDTAAMERATRESAAALSPYEHEFRRRMAATGEVRWFHSRSMPRRREDGAVMWDGVEFDITEQKHAAEARQQSEALLQAITDHSEDMIFVKDRDLRLLFLNPAGCRLHGLAAGQLLGRTDAQIHPDAAQATAFAEVDRRVMESRRTEIFEEEFTTPDGEKKTLLTAKTPRLDEHGHVVGIIGIARDITERKRAEELLKVSLHEKEVLLREVHHRVKNNLQIVSSLLNLQSRTLTDPALLQVFASTRDRVRAMAAVHERLYESGDFAQIDLAVHLGKLARTLTLAHAPTRVTVQPVLQLESVTVDLNTAVPLSLIASELITNALKYGFAGGRTGTLTIGLRAGGGHHELRIGDDGPGFPAALDPATSRTLGLRLVRDLSRQIRAELEIDSTAAGTNVVVRWPARLAATEPAAPPSQNDAVGAVPLSTQRRGDAEGAETLHPGIGPQKG